MQKDNKLIKLLIFDKVNASNPLAPLPTKYFLGKEGAIIVYESKYSIFDDKYDIYDNIKENIELIKANADFDTKIILFENKCDLEKNIEIEEKIKQLGMNMVLNILKFRIKLDIILMKDLIH